MEDKLCPSLRIIDNNLTQCFRYRCMTDNVLTECLSYWSPGACLQFRLNRLCYLSPISTMLLPCHSLSIVLFPAL